MQRGVILQLLAAAGGGPVAFRALFDMMDRRNVSVSRQELKHHLEMVLAQGSQQHGPYVGLERARDLPFYDDDDVNPDDILFVTLKPAGLSLVNRSITDLEVFLP